LFEFSAFGIQLSGTWRHQESFGIAAIVGHGFGGGLNYTVEWWAVYLPEEEVVIECCPSQSLEGITETGRIPWVL
jgi:hypothetical protein